MNKVRWRTLHGGQSFHQQFSTMKIQKIDYADNITYCCSSGRSRNGGGSRWRRRAGAGRGRGRGRAGTGGSGTALQ